MALYRKLSENLSGQHPGTRVEMYLLIYVLQGIPLAILNLFFSMAILLNLVKSSSTNMIFTKDGCARHFRGAQLPSFGLERRALT